MSIVVRRARTAGLGAAAVAAALALSAPGADAAPAGTGALSCSTEISSSAASGGSTTATRCTRDGRLVAPPATRGSDSGATAVTPGLEQRRASTDVPAAGWVSTGLRFRNSTASTVSITIMYYDPSTCGAYGSWATQGWWNVAPGAEVTVKNTNNRYATFHAYSSRLSWSGPYSVYVKSTAFQSCVGLGSTASRVVGERLVDLGPVGAFPYTTYTVNLTG